MLHRRLAPDDETARADNLREQIEGLTTTFAEARPTELAATCKVSNSLVLPTDEPSINVTTFIRCLTGRVGADSTDQQSRI